MGSISRDVQVSSPRNMFSGYTQTDFYGSVATLILERPRRRKAEQREWHVDRQNAKSSINAKSTDSERSFIFFTECNRCNGNDVATLSGEIRGIPSEKTHGHPSCQRRREKMPLLSIVAALI